jgi:hypothetical protein
VAADALAARQNNFLNNLNNFGFYVRGPPARSQQ